MSGPTVKELAKAGDPLLRRAAGMVRRMAVAATTKILWRLTGVRGLEGDTEQLDVEVFSGIGIYARPAGNGQPEAVVVNVGNAKLPVIVATRDAKSLQAMIKALGGAPGAGELVVFPPAGGAVIYCRANGTIEIRSPGGVASELMTKADGDALRTWILTHAHTGVTTGVGTSGPPLTTAPAAAGTTVLKGE